MQRAWRLPTGTARWTASGWARWSYIDLLNRARDYIHIMTPYLILDGELETALKFAAERGVDVHLILPRKAGQAVPLRTGKEPLFGPAGFGREDQRVEPRLCPCQGIRGGRRGKRWWAPSIWTTAACTITLRMPSSWQIATQCWRSGMI